MARETRALPGRSSDYIRVPTKNLALPEQLRGRVVSPKAPRPQTRPTAEPAHRRHGTPQTRPIADTAHRRHGTPQRRARWGWRERLGPYRGGHRAASRGQKPTVSDGVKTNETCRFKTHWKRRGTDLLSLTVGDILFHPAGIRAKFDFIPDLFPLLAPHKGSTADDTWLGGQVGFLPHLGHPNTSTAIGVKSTG